MVTDNHHDKTFIENRTFDELQIGDSAGIERRLTMDDIKLFAVMSGDVNPAHVDEDFAKSSRFQEIIAHGRWGGALISTVLGTEMPGPGTIYLGQNLRFKAPVRPGDTVHAKVTVKEVMLEKRRVILDTVCTVQDKVVIEGDALVMPTSRTPRA